MNNQWNVFYDLFQVYFADVNPSGSAIIPVRGIATDMAMLDSAYFLSQVVLSCIMGYIVYMTGSVLSYMATAGVMGIFSLYFIQNIITCKQELVGSSFKLDAFTWDYRLLYNNIDDVKPGSSFILVRWILH